MKWEWQSMARTCFALYTPASCFDPCDVFAQNNLHSRGTGLKIWQYLFFSERDVASKLLLIPFQPFVP